MTRVTNSMLASNYLTNMNRNLNNTQILQSQLSSGKEISRPSHDPYKVSRTMQLYTEIDENKQYNENIKDVSNWLDTTDTALNQAGNVFARVRELLVTAGNGAYDVDERKAIQDEIKEKVNELSQILNTNFDGAYIFGGTKSTSKPVMVDGTGKLCYADKNGNPIDKTSNGVSIDLSKNPITSSVSPANNKSINGIVKDNATNKITVKIKDSTNTPPTESTSEINLNDVDLTATPPKTVESLFQTNLQSDGFTKDDAEKAFNSYNSLEQIGAELNVEISQGVMINYNKNATDILEYKDKTGTSKNVMDVLSDIIKNLNSPTDPTNPGDKSKLTGECIVQMDAMIGNLLQRRSEVGAMTNRMESAQTKNEEENLNMTNILSKTEDIDFTQKMMEYSMMQTVYMASLQTSAKILPTTLLDYLR